MKSHFKIKSFPLFAAILLAFIVSLKGHVSLIMYPLSAVIFYFYLPMLYAVSRNNVLHNMAAKEFMHVSYYPVELSLWLIASCFFAFILAHFIADILFDITHLHEFMLPLIVVYLGLIIYRELRSEKLQERRQNSNYEHQGRLLSFEILFVFMFIFTLHQ